MNTSSGEAFLVRTAGGVPPAPRPARVRMGRRGRSYCMLRLDSRGHVTDLPLFGPALFDHSGDDLVHRPIVEIFAERSRAAARAAIARFRLASPARRHLRCDDLLWVVRRDRAEIPVRLSVSWAEQARMVIVLRDLRDELRAECASTAWSFAELALNDTLDYEQTVATTASCAARSLGSAAIVETDPFAGDAGRVRAATACEADPDRVQVIEANWSSSGLRALLYAAEPDRPRLIPVVRGARAGEIEALCARSAMVVPLFAGTHRLGALTWLSTDPGRLFSRSDLSLAAELGRRAARAIENARLFRRAQLSAKDGRKMMAVVAHELGVAWAAVQRWAGERAQDAVFQETPGAAEALAAATMRIGRLVAELRDVGEIEAGRLDVDTTCRASPARLVSAAVTAARIAAEERRIEADLAPGLAEVWADEARVRRVFANLIDNAIKFSSRHETITVGAEPGARAGEVQFFVRDAGIGIADDDRRHVFERGWKANPADRRGLGLGLAICKSIVESHGGSLAAISRLGEGSRFVFVLRAAPSGRDGNQ